MATHAASSTSSSNGGSVAQLLLKAVAACIGAALLLLLVLLALPDGNDMAQVHIDKHRRLESAGSPKMVFVGGSGLMYGLDTVAVENALGMKTVNMGLDGFLGTRFLTNEVRDVVQEGDVVVLGFEYEAWFENGPYDLIEGAGPDHLMLVKVRPQSLRYLTSFRQYYDLALAVPRAAQSKVLRLVDAGLDSILHRKRDEDPATALIESIEVHAGFNEHGDLVNHLGKQWTYEFADSSPKMQGEDAEVSERLVRLIQEFRSDMRSRGVTVLVAPPPAPAPWYEANHASIEAAFTRVGSLFEGGGVEGLIARPGKFVWARSYFFDDANHLNGDGRVLRTQAVIDSLRPIVAALSSVRRSGQQVTDTGREHLSDSTVTRDVQMTRVDEVLGVGELPAGGIHHSGAVAVRDVAHDVVVSGVEPDRRGPVQRAND
jgi:hypothetical protein